MSTVSVKVLHSQNSLSQRFSSRILNQLNIVIISQRKQKCVVTVIAPFTDVSIESVTSQLRALGHSSKNDVLGFDCKL